MLWFEICWGTEKYWWFKLIPIACVRVNKTKTARPINSVCASCNLYCMCICWPICQIVSLKMVDYLCGQQWQNNRFCRNHLKLIMGRHYFRTGFTTFSTRFNQRSKHLAFLSNNIFKTPKFFDFILVCNFLCIQNVY